MFLYSVMACHFYALHWGKDIEYWVFLVDLNKMHTCEVGPRARPQLQLYNQKTEIGTLGSLMSLQYSTNTESQKIPNK